MTGAQTGDSVTAPATTKPAPPIPSPRGAGDPREPGMRRCDQPCCTGRKEEK